MLCMGFGLFVGAMRLELHSLSGAPDPTSLYWEHQGDVQTRPIRVSFVGSREEIRIASSFKDINMIVGAKRLELPTSSM